MAATCGNRLKQNSTLHEKMYYRKKLYLFETFSIQLLSFPQVKSGVDSFQCKFII